jgi:hypothetical protein
MFSAVFLKVKYFSRNMKWPLHSFWKSELKVVFFLLLTVVMDHMAGKETF